MNDKEQKESSSFWLEEEEAAELTDLSQEEKKSTWRRVLTAIVLILILLLLFWPVDKSKLKTPKRNANSSLKRQQAGTAHYQVLAATPLSEGQGAKTFTVKVTFKIKNLGTRPAQLSFNMVSLQDNNGVTYEPASSFTVDWYEKEGKKSPWDEMLEPKKSLKAVVFFNVFKGPKKQYVLVGRDFDWTTQEAKTISAGSF
jgi:hypothetical protein